MTTKARENFYVYHVNVKFHIPKFLHYPLTLNPKSRLVKPKIINVFYPPTKVKVKLANIYRTRRLIILLTRRVIMMIDWQVLLTPRSEDVSFITILSDLHDRVKHAFRWPRWRRSTSIQTTPPRHGDNTPNEHGRRSIFK
ncbi:hypothetical protein YC2023_085377 [Brassica napus]